MESFLKRLRDCISRESISSHPPFNNPTAKTFGFRPFIICSNATHNFKGSRKIKAPGIVHKQLSFKNNMMKNNFLIQFVHPSLH